MSSPGSAGGDADAATAARESIRRHSRSFSFASRLLPAAKRSDVERLYAWCRWCDDGVDTAASPAAAATFVAEVGRDLKLIADGREPAAAESRWLATLVSRHRLSIPAAEALLTGMQSDLVPAVDFRAPDLLRYCFRVAGAVGVLMCPLLGLRDHSFLPHAAALGMGMQLTNIARDVAEDWQRGRCYLPVEWSGSLRPSGAAPDAECVGSGVRRVLEVADGFYAAGNSGIPALDADARLAVRAASGIYRAIGTQIRRRGYRVLHERARVTWLGKLRLFSKAALTGMILERGPQNIGNLDSPASQSLATARDLLLEHGVST
ncbi:MAG: phytoene/squalene synthase family protein [Planctomycetia bacterium]|nr:phytoene/squalene synthase family protein [Planctomycetia bacterium]